MIIIKDEQNDVLQSSVTEKETQITNLQTELGTKDDVIAELGKRPTLKEAQDARAVSVLLRADTESRQVKLTLAIEESDNLVKWTNIEEKLIRSVDMPEGKKFYCFTLDK